MVALVVLVAVAAGFMMMGSEMRAVLPSDPKQQQTTYTYYGESMKEREEVVFIVPVGLWIKGIRNESESYCVYGGSLNR